LARGILLNFGTKIVKMNNWQQFGELMFVYTKLDNKKMLRYSGYLSLYFYIGQIKEKKLD